MLQSNQQTDQIPFQTSQIEEENPTKNKTVEFSMQQNTIKEFEKNSNLQESNSLSQEDLDITRHQQNLEDQLERDLDKTQYLVRLKKSTVVEKIRQLNRSEAVEKALKDTFSDTNYCFLI